MDESNVVGVFRLFGMTENILKYIFVILAVCFFVHGDSKLLVYYIFYL